jgi:hypothetical protein
MCHDTPFMTDGHIIDLTNKIRIVKDDAAQNFIARDQPWWKALSHHDISWDQLLSCYGEQTLKVRKNHPA